MSLSRRSFVKTVTLSATGVILGGDPVCGFSGQSGHNRLVLLAQSNRLRRQRGDIDQILARRILDQALMELTGRGSSENAWRKLFPPHHKVGIKLSCLPGKKLSSSQGLVFAIVDGLLSAGIKKKNIFIWERTNRELKQAGFTLSRKGPNVFGTDDLFNGGYSTRIEYSGSVGTCFSRIMEMVDALISVPVLKDHDIAGVSIGLKNFYGAIYNPNKFHGNRCDPYVADLCNHPFIKNKLRLTVCDASRIQIHNGPAFYPRYAREYGGLLISTDPVALDRVGWQIIEDNRAEMNLKSLRASGREPSYIFRAGKLKLGNASLKNIELKKI